MYLCLCGISDGLYIYIMCVWWWCVSDGSEEEEGQQRTFLAEADVRKDNRYLLLVYLRIDDSSWGVQWEGAICLLRLMDMATPVIYIQMVKRVVCVWWQLFISIIENVRVVNGWCVITVVPRRLSWSAASPRHSDGNSRRSDPRYLYYHLLSYMYIYIRMYILIHTRHSDGNSRRSDTRAIIS
jgi:hypothetical protein